MQLKMFGAIHLTSESASTALPSTKGASDSKRTLSPSAQVPSTLVPEKPPHAQSQAGSMSPRSSSPVLKTDEKLQGGKSKRHRRPSDFVGLTLDELDFFHSSDKWQHKTLRDRLDSRIRTGQLNLKKGRTGNWEARLRADWAWRAGLKLLMSYYPSRLVAGMVSDLLGSNPSMEQIEAIAREPKLLLEVGKAKVSKPRL